MRLLPTYAMPLPSWKRETDDYRITAVTNLSEFSDTYDSFNRMAEKLKELLLETIQKEQQRQQLVVDNLQLQLNYLQLQIRPHFLHNNMNLLYTLIQNNQTDAAQSLVLYLSDYFRYMFRKGHDRALFDHEMKLIREYLDISRLHYPDAFTFSCQIDPLFKPCPYPSAAVAWVCRKYYPARPGSRSYGAHHYLW